MSQHETLKIGVTNLSRQADVVAKQVGVFYGSVERWSRLKKRADWAVMLTGPGDLPRRPAPDEHVDLLMPMPPVDSIERLLKARRLDVIDSRGRRHCASRRELSELQVHLLKRQTRLDAAL